MAFATIAKAHVARWAVRPNLLDYEAARTRDFWERAWKELDGLPGGRGVNI